MSRWPAASVWALARRLAGAWPLLRVEASGEAAAADCGETVAADFERRVFVVIRREKKEKVRGSNVTEKTLIPSTAFGKRGKV